MGVATTFPDIENQITFVSNGGGGMPRFGDILSNQALALSGGLGLACSLNRGATHAVANAGHGSAPDIAGRGIANPVGMILSSAMLIDHQIGRASCRERV